MGFYGGLGGPVGVDEDLWGGVDPMGMGGPYGGVRGPIDTYGNLWGPLGTYGDP